MIANRKAKPFVGAEQTVDEYVGSSDASGFPKDPFC